MANVERDPISGQMTTGHEWDGIKELNTPLPRWWVYIFWATIVWSVGYWIVYPAWPTLSGHTKGIWNYSSRAELAAEMKMVAADRQAWLAKIKDLSAAEIEKNPELLRYAMAGGKSAFGENCQPCHGAGGAGAPGYPALGDDEWIWGGSLAAIEQTIAHGVRAEDSQTRASEMPKFSDSLKAPEIDALADYVVALAARKAAETMPGAKLFAENCVACHGEKGEGNRDLGAPRLDNALWLYSGDKAQIVAQIAAPKHGVMPAWSGRLDAATIKQLAIYVHKLGGGE